MKKNKYIKIKTLCTKLITISIIKKLKHFFNHIIFNVGTVTVYYPIYFTVAPMYEHFVMNKRTDRAKA